MTENDVKVIVQEAQNDYEERIGAPRHLENTRKIDRMTWIGGVGLGVVATLQVLLSAGVIHVAAK